nr:hypothetical protein [uncultured Caproiciproducens sp.]
MSYTAAIKNEDIRRDYLILCNKKTAMFFSNEEHSLLIVYPMAFIKLFLVLFENRGIEILLRMPVMFALVQEGDHSPMNIISAFRCNNVV